MTKDEVFLEGKRLGITIDRRQPLSRMIARLESERGYREQKPEEADASTGPKRPAFLRNIRTGKIWPYRPEWATNPELEPYNEDP